MFQNKDYKYRRLHSWIHRDPCTRRCLGSRHRRDRVRARWCRRSW